MESAITSKDKIASKYQADACSTEKSCSRNSITKGSHCTYSNVHIYISRVREPALVETAGKLLERNILKYQTQNCWHYQQLASATGRSTAIFARDGPWVQRCRSSLKMVLYMSNIFHHLFGYSDLYDANSFPNIY